MGTFSTNTTLKVSRVLINGDTVSATGYGILTYRSLQTLGGTTASTYQQMYVGPGHVVAGTIVYNTVGINGNIMEYYLQSGVEFVNSP